MSRAQKPGEPQAKKIDPPQSADEASRRAAVARVWDYLYAKTAQEILAAKATERERGESESESEGAAEE